ncbi:hypothetical protein A3A40_01780 [Candidatus Kaiserbacteria bacterium RIFCSPLOWO2_01_FULL_54_20]|uniref:N-acetyltransferase domain-containing protein n=1 Tax=Candidatus Kaiserbacteria bacterium RIFCSPLOWO2_01_FULL_54_20 TaxID=1798513 RepID=A0A1F6EKF5_9BACT|nr:MAG: hypothetical protein A3A40_01780 [Candidatus Kaiserbacteria bacterium RIFCSPLOWO2_01_FULL_54_20]
MGVETLQNRPKPVLLVPMTEQDMENAIRTIAEAFGTDDDPEQAPPSVEQFKGLQRIDPYALVLRKDEAGKIIGWSGLVPTSNKLAEAFVKKEMDENQIIQLASTSEPSYEAMYLWAFYNDPKSSTRQAGETLRLIKSQFKQIMADHPTIKRFYSWGFSPVGAELLERLSKDLGITIEMRPGSHESQGKRIPDNEI